MFFVFSGQVFGENEVKIIINKKVNKLAYFKNGLVIKTFPVATGKSVSLTPEGNFKVIRKLVNPYYSKGKVAGGSPNNPLGVRWLGLDAMDTPGDTYGIHGNNNPRSIGKYASAGCIRMYNEDVTWLYQNTPLGTVVEIINEEWDIEQKPITVMVNDIKLASTADMKPFMINNRVMVSGRLLAESIGCAVTWNGALRQAILNNGRINVIATVGAKQITVNGETKDIDVPVTLRDDRVYIPVRAFAEAFGFTVTWEGKTHTVSLVKSAVYPVLPIESTGSAPTVPGTVYRHPNFQDSSLAE